MNDGDGAIASVLNEGGEERGKGGSGNLEEAHEVRGGVKPQELALNVGVVVGQ